MKIRLKTSLLLIGAFLMAVATSCNDEKVPFKQTPVNTEDPEPIVEFLKTKAPVAQTFSEDASTAFSITTQNNLVFGFNKNAFNDAQGNPVAGMVDIEITEYMDKVSMILGGVTTTSGNDILESDGMFNIRISQNGSDVALNGTYFVTIPTDQVDPAMQIFIGAKGTDPGGNEIIEWTETKESWILQDSGVRNDSTYRLALNFLSWCNLDKYYQGEDGVQVRLKVPDGYTNQNTTAILVFEGETAVSLYGDKDKEEFNSMSYRLSEGWKIKYFVLTNKGGKLAYAILDATIEKGKVHEITSFTEISEDDLEDLIKTL